MRQIIDGAKLFMDRLGPGMRACDWLVGVPPGHLHLSARDDSALGLARGWGRYPVWVKGRYLRRL